MLLLLLCGHGFFRYGTMIWDGRRATFRLIDDRWLALLILRALSSAGCICGYIHAGNAARRGT